MRSRHLPADCEGSGPYVPSFRNLKRSSDKAAVSPHPAILRSNQHRLKHQLSFLHGKELFADRDPVVARRYFQDEGLHGKAVFKDLLHKVLYQQGTDLFLDFFYRPVGKKLFIVFSSKQTV